MKLNLGCGRDIKSGWVNIDREKLPGVDKVIDLERPRYGTHPSHVMFPYDEDVVDEIFMSHVLEHIHNPLSLMEELHRIAKPNCLLTIKCPYGSSDNADEDPQHVRRYFLNSFAYFSQPTYWRADYDYQGDWQAKKITLEISGHRFQDVPDPIIMQEIMQKRNLVSQMTVQMEAVKPAREPKKELMEKVPVQWEFT